MIDGDFLDLENRLHGGENTPEPGDNFSTTGNFDCTCDFCQGFRAANALHGNDTCCHWSSPFEAELQKVVAA